MIKENFERIKSEVGDKVIVIAVTKYHTVEETLEAYKAGVRHFGENRIEGFLEKRKALPDDAVVHYIGTLQSRKVKDVASHLTYLHSLERESAAKKIEQYAENSVKCFVQVNISGEETKHGVKPEELEEFVKNVSQYDKINIIGLMTMAPFTEDASILEETFSTLKVLRDQLHQHFPSITELSMGMSNDYLYAVNHGASFVRIGSKIMGSR